MKEEKDNIAPDVIEKVTNHVYKNYKNMENKRLYISQSDVCYFVSTHKDASPLIVGKNFENPVTYK
jgi:hypothetical protein